MVEKRDSPLRVTFFGDSICVGQGVSIHGGWVTRIAAKLDDIANAHGREIVVTNASINGNTTRQALERMPYDVQSNGVDILIVQFGMNDCNYWETDRGLPRVSHEAFAANLSEIIRRGQTFGAQHVFLQTNHPATRGPECFPNTNIGYGASNHAYNDIIRGVGAQADDGVTFSDVEAAFIDHIDGDRSRLEALLLADGLHLSRQGHDLYFQFLAEKFERSVLAMLDA